MNLESSRVKNMLVTTNKNLYGIAPPYLRSLMEQQTTAYSLRGTLKSDLPRVTTTSYGLQSFRYAAPRVWNTLPDNIRTSESLIALKCTIQNITVKIFFEDKTNNMHICGNFIHSYFINFVAFLKYYYTRRYKLSWAILNPSLNKVICTYVWMTGIIRMPGMTRDDWED